MTVVAGAGERTADVVVAAVRVAADAGMVEGRSVEEEAADEGVAVAVGEGEVVPETGVGATSEMTVRDVVDASVGKRVDAVELALDCGVAETATG